MGDKIGYSDFIRICEVDDPQDFVGLEVRHDGVWVIAPAEDVLLSPEERAILSEHPAKDLTKPALPFPCSEKQLSDFLKFYGLNEFKIEAPSRKERKDSNIRKACRRFAKENWTAGMTCKDIYNHNEIQKIAGEKLPTLKTFRDRWMKGLNPRSKGKTA